MFGSKVRSKWAMSVAVPIAMVMVTTVGTPAGATAKPTAIPVVKSFTISKTTVANSGGSVVLKGKLKYAVSCRITVSPGLKGFSKSFACGSDSFTKTVAFAANKSENPIEYTFGMSVKNQVGSAQATNVVATEGAAPPPISFTTPTGNASTLVFAPEGVFVADDPLIVTVHNNSTTTQVITSVAIGTTGDPSDFILNRNNCGYITARETCSLAVQFQPSGAGSRSGVVNILDASWGKLGATVPLKLSGRGVWASATVANANIRGNKLSFPAQYGVATASPYEFISLANAGSVPLYINGIGDTGGETTDFLVAAGNCVNPITQGFPLVVAVGQSCTFGVAFDPSASGLRTTNVVVFDNTIGTQTQLKVQGTGYYSTTTLAIGGGTSQPSPISYNFTGPIVSATVTVANTSPVTVVFGGTSVSGINPSDFSISPTNTCGQANVELAAGQSCTIQIGFAPLAKGPRAAVLHIFDNSPDGGEIISVTGTG